MREKSQTQAMGKGRSRSPWLDASVQVGAVMTLTLMGLVIHFVLLAFTLKSTTILYVLVAIAIFNLVLRGKWGPLLVLLIVAILEFRAVNHRLVLVPNYDSFSGVNLALIASVIGYIAAQFQFLTSYDRATANANTPDGQPEQDDSSSFVALAARYLWVLILPAWPYLSTRALDWLMQRDRKLEELAGLPDGVTLLLSGLWLFGLMTLLAWAAYWFINHYRESPLRARLYLLEEAHGELRRELRSIAHRSRRARK